MDQTPSFYDALAPMFDVMTDWEARLEAEGPFLRAQLEAVAARRVLDVACGSGGHALWLASLGYEVAGEDSSAVMIALAREKAAAAGLAVPFAVADLIVGHQSSVVSSQSAAVGGQRSAVGDPQAFDAVLCLGNSLPHLLSQEDLVAAVRRMSETLRPDGLLVLQNLNYDLRWRTQPRWFAAQGGVLDGQPVLVWRFADYDESAGRIAFHIALFRQDGGQWRVQVHTTPQRPLFHADLLAALSDAGFGDVRAYGKMALPPEPFDPHTSGDLVIVAQKRGA
jgi:2-polyprenyl-3-methyl-5-hydroxy-6-metoxy-1,4-benzoquinol methylase